MTSADFLSGQRSGRPLVRPLAQRLVAASLGVALGLLPLHGAGQSGDPRRSAGKPEPVASNPSDAAAARGAYQGSWLGGAGGGLVGPEGLRGGAGMPGGTRDGAPPPSSGSAAQNLPRLGDAAGDELSPLTERRIGEAIMRDLRRDRSVLDDVEVTEYLNRFAARLSETPAANGFTFEFFLVKDSTLNAFALPGGMIGVHTGLMSAAQSESELASVLAHEIGHVTQRHIARMLSQQRQTSVLTLAGMVLAALAARSNPQAAMGAMAMGGSAQQQMMLSFSRDAEREADRVGFEMLRDSGFDPNGMVAFFGRLQSASRIYESSAPAYVRSHPLTTERIADMQARIRDEGRYRQRADSIEFQLSRAKLRALAETDTDGLRLARGQFERQLRDRSTGDERAAWFGIATAALAQRDFAGADRALAEVRRRTPAGHPFIERLAADIRLQQGDARGALAIAQSATQRFPLSRALVHMQAQALIDAGEGARAVTYLRDQLATYRSDAQLWRLIAQAYHQQGQAGEAHRATAEEYALLGGWMAAIDQLRLALRSGKLDFYASSQVDSRIRELQAQYTLDRQDRAGR
ncbi:MAG TPA: M48 family metalloprotease [Burkholderiaceae bacterium]|mgnify:CR=1 FL=1|nr:M48 family metalloprotease [Burkholderiaceae bacterium]